VDLSGEDVDAAAMLPATAVQRLDPPPYVLEERPDTLSFFLCLGADNRRENFGLLSFSIFISAFHNRP